MVVVRLGSLLVRSAVFFLDILVLPTTALRLAPTTRSRAPGVPLRCASVCSRRAIFRSLPLIREELEVRDFLLSRIDLPMRRLSVLLPLTAGLRVTDFCEAEIDGVLVVGDSFLRDFRLFDLPIIDTLPELAAGCLVPVPIEPPMRDLDALIPEFDLLPELATGCLADEEADGLYMRIVFGFLNVLPELLCALELVFDRLVDDETDGLLVLIVPPILDLVLVVGCLVEDDTDGLLTVIDLPIRALLLGLSRTLEFRLTEVEPVEFRLIEVLDDGLREAEESGRLEMVIRFDVVPRELLLEDIVPERPGVERLTVILLELLRLGNDRLEEIELERFGEYLRTVIPRELLRLEVDLPDEIELERFGVDLLTDILLELLRLGAERLTDDLAELLRLGAERLDVIVLDRLELGARLIEVLVELFLLEIDLLELWPADIERERLGVGARFGVGARLTEDRLLEGVGARLGAAALADCADLLELRELELFRELLATSTESAVKAKRKIKIISRKSNIFAKRYRKTCNLELFLYVSMTASFLLLNCKRAYAPHITGINLSYRNKVFALKSIFFRGFICSEAKD